MTYGELPENIRPEERRGEERRGEYPGEVI